MPDVLNGCKMRMSWIEPNILAAGSIPVSLQDIQSLHAQGIRSVLSLTEHSLLEFHEISHSLLAALDMIYTHEPVPDQHPPTLKQAQRIIRFISEMITQQRPLFIHCHAGGGRTGTILHLYYLAQGLSWEETRVRIRATRIECLLLSEKQLTFLQAWGKVTERASKSR